MPLSPVSHSNTHLHTNAHVCAFTFMYVHRNTLQRPFSVPSLSPYMIHREGRMIPYLKGSKAFALSFNWLLCYYCDRYCLAEQCKSKGGFRLTVAEGFSPLWWEGVMAQLSVAGAYGNWSSMEVHQEAERITKASMTKARGIITLKHTPILIYFHHDPGCSAFKLATQAGDRVL